MVTNYCGKKDINFVYKQASLEMVYYCILYSVQCTVYCTLYTTVYSIQCTVYSVHCTVYSVQYTVYTSILRHYGEMSIEQHKMVR